MQVATNKTAAKSEAVLTVDLTEEDDDVKALSSSSVIEIIDESIPIGNTMDSQDLDLCFEGDSQMTESQSLLDSTSGVEPKSKNENDSNTPLPITDDILPVSLTSSRSKSFTDTPDKVIKKACAPVESQDMFATCSQSESAKEVATEKSEPVQPSQDPEPTPVPISTLSPTVLDNLLRKTKRPIHSQFIDIDALLNKTISDESTSSKNGETNELDDSNGPQKENILEEGAAAAPSSASPDKDSGKQKTPPPKYVQSNKRKPKKSPTKYKDECHQTLLLDPTAVSQVSSSNSSSSTENNYSESIDKSQTQNTPLDTDKVLTGAEIESSNESVTEINPIPLPQIDTPDNGNLECSGSIVAKASKKAEENLLQAAQQRESEKADTELQKRHRENRLDSLEFGDTQLSEPSQSGKKTAGVDGGFIFTESNPVVSDKDKSSAVRQSMSPSKSSESDCPKVDPKQSDTGSTTDDVSRPGAKRTSTPNCSNLIQGFATDISSGLGSNSEKEDKADEAHGNAAGADEPIGVVERGLSTRTTVDLLHEDPMNYDRSPQSIDDVLAQGFVKREVIVLQVQVWHNAADNRTVYTCERNDEEFVLKELPFKRKKVKSKRESSASTLSSTSSGYRADKSSSSDSSTVGYKRTSDVHMRPPSNRLSLESVQILPSVGEFVQPTTSTVRKRVLKTKQSLGTVLEQSSSDETEVAKHSKYKRSKVKSLSLPAPNNASIQDSIHSTTASDAELIDLTTTEPSSKKNRSYLSSIKNRGLHYELDKFIEDLSQESLSALCSVKLPEGESALFLEESNSIDPLTVIEEQVYAMLTSINDITLLPNMLVLAKFGEIYYSAIIKDKPSANMYHIKYILDDREKKVSIENILPISLLPRGQICYRHYQSEDRHDSLASIEGRVQGHAILNGMLVHLVEDRNRATYIPLSHLSIRADDENAKRFFGRWETMECIGKRAQVCPSNVVVGKRIRTPVNANVITTPTRKTSAKRTVRKPKSDPSFDTSLTEVEAASDVPAAEASDYDERQPKRLKTDDVIPTKCNLSDEDVEESNSSDETYTPKTKGKTPRRKAPTIAPRKIINTKTIDGTKSSKSKDGADSNTNPERLEPERDSGVAKKATQATPKKGGSKDATSREKDTLGENVESGTSSAKKRGRPPGAGEPFLHI